MWNKPSKERLSRIPKLYETEHIPLQDKLIHLHIFLGGCDWYICEFDGNDIMWGFAILNNDLLNAEWSYISLSELKAVRIGHMEVDCESPSCWRIRPACEVEKIRLAHPHWQTQNTNLHQQERHHEL